MSRFDVSQSAHQVAYSYANARVNAAWKTLTGTVSLASRRHQRRYLARYDSSSLLVAVNTVNLADHGEIVVDRGKKEKDHAFTPVAIILPRDGERCASATRECFTAIKRGKDPGALSVLLPFASH